MQVCNRQLLALLFFLCFISSLHAQAPYTIYGNVRQPDGSPASRATVSITGNTGLNRSSYADDMGRFEMPNLPRGRYRLTALNPADAEQFMDPLDVDLNPFTGSRVSVQLYLRYKSKVSMPRVRKGGTASLEEEAQHVPKPAQKAWEKAIELRSAEKYDQSLKSFDKAIEAFPEYFQAITDRGHLLIAMQKPAEAARDFARALEVNPHYGPALRGAGMCEFQQGRFAEAARDLKEAVDAEPGSATTYLFLGAAALALDRRDQARASLQKALSIDADGAARAHVHLANLWIRENKPQEAIAEIEAYLAAVPNAPDAAKLRAIVAQLHAQPPKS